MPKLNLDNPVFRVMGALGDMVMLNAAWILCCLPVVTIGASTVSLCTVAQKLVSGKDCRVWKEFFRAFRTNWKTATVAWIPLLGLGALFAADLIIAFQTPDALGSLFRGTGIVLCLLWLAAAGNAFALLARYEYNPLQVIWDGVLLSISRPLSALVSITAVMWLPLLAAVDGRAALYLLPIWLLVAGAVWALGLSAALQPAFRKLEEKKEETPCAS